MRFIDLFAGLGGFHLALKSLGHECVFASEIDDELQEIYRINFPDVKGHVFGDLREVRHRIPGHDILCAGFPCQPFSKSGFQRGMRDKTRGTLFHEIVEIVKKHSPRYVLLENVGNFERHDDGRTWQIVRDSFAQLGYAVRGTEHVKSGGHGLISPHHMGFPHARERFYIVASREQGLARDPFPKVHRQRHTSLSGIVETRISKRDVEETTLTAQQVDCIDHWNRLLQRIPARIDLPSFPIWGDEIHARYPYQDETPWASNKHTLLASLRRNGAWAGRKKSEILELLPSYARTETITFPSWKIAFIRQNREWFQRIRDHFPADWVRRLREFPPSLRKLEWNCKGEERDLWRYVLQFRPSGLRAKRYTSSPALVAMTTTQIPILGPQRRFITRTEGLRLQGFSDEHRLPTARADAFRALGNAVHVGVVRAIAKGLVG